MICFLLSPRFHTDTLLDHLGAALLGPVYAALPLFMLGLIEWRPQGRWWIFFLLAVIFASDTGAYYAGKIFGKRKLYEKVSPGKTWEGVIGGLLSSVIGALFLAFLIRFFGIHFPITTGVIVLAVFMSASGVVGDLVESMFKRRYGIKDSGWILPGHGGILDRIDSLLFSIPILYFFLSWS